MRLVTFVIRDASGRAVPMDGEIKNEIGKLFSVNRRRRRSEKCLMIIVRCVSLKGVTVAVPG